MNSTLPAYKITSADGNSYVTSMAKDVTLEMAREYFSDKTVSRACTSITLIGRRWFQRSYGNTYHSVTIMIDGETVHVSGKCYGYDRAYVQTAQEWLKANGYLDGMSERDALWNYCANEGIKFEYSATDVAREKDL